MEIKKKNLKPLTRLFKTNDGMSKIRKLEIIIEFKKHSNFASKTKMHINVLREKWKLAQNQNIQHGILLTFLHSLHNLPLLFFHLA